MKKQLTGIACVLAMVLSAPVMADEYSEAYNCAIEALQSGYDLGPAAFCVGNSRDPSLLEEQAYEAAERDFKSGKTAQVVQCPFEFGVWIANGSRSDGFEEGAQLLSTLTEVANLLAVSREVFMYDINGNRITVDIANQWFARQGNGVVVSQEAARQCPSKIN